MYQVDGNDRVIRLKDVPKSSGGAPIPIVLAGEHDVFLTYYVQNEPDDWDGSLIEVNPDSEQGFAANIMFKKATAHMFGSPNDETFSGHPLARKGLKPYGIFEVQNSSWIRSLEKVNSVHRYHDKVTYMQNKRHFVFAFHDSTFECVAESFVVEVKSGSVKKMVAEALDTLR